MDFLIVDVTAVAVAAAAMLAISVIWQKIVMQQDFAIAHIALAAVLSLVSAYAIGLFIAWAGITDTLGGGVMGLIAAVGLIAPALLAVTIFEKRSVTLFRYGIIRILIEMTAAGAILGSW